MYSKKLLLMAGVAGLALLGALPLQAKTDFHDLHRAMATGVTGFVAPVSRIQAVALVLGNEFSVASANSTGWPDPVGHHWHSDDGNTYGTGTDWMEVGECCADGAIEEARGMAEFDIFGAVSADSATVEVQVAQFGGLFGQSGPGDFTIEVYAYQANNVEEISDYNIAGTLVGSFGSAGLSVAQVLQFDVTAEYNAAVSAASPGFGIRLQPASEPNDLAVVFGNAALTFASDPPLPPQPQSEQPIPSGTPTGMLVLLLILLGTGLAILRTRGG